MGGRARDWGHRKGLEVSAKPLPQQAVILMVSDSTQEVGSRKNVVVGNYK